MAIVYRGNGSRIFSIILVLIIVAVAVVALVSVGRTLLGGDQQNPEHPDTSQQSLLDTSTTHSVRMTVRGALVADENFRSYQIIVTPDNRALTTYTGYLEQPLAAKQYSNNVKAYDEFVHALDKANLSKGTAFTGDKDDIRGICATGRVYEFDIISSGVSVKHLWTSTCKGSPGSLKASVDQLTSLFLTQIPDNKKLLQDIKLSEQ